MDIYICISILMLCFDVTSELHDMFWSLTQLKMDGLTFFWHEQRALIEEEFDLQSSSSDHSS